MAFFIWIQGATSDLQVHHDIRDASKKLVMKIDSSQAPSLSSSEVAEKNLLKGITPDESTTIYVKIPLPCNLMLHIIREE